MELLEDSLKLINLPYTFLLFLCLLYWLNVFVGFITPDFIDLQFEGDVDVDLDIDDVSFSSSVWASSAQFLYLGTVPIMIIITVLSTLMWVFSVLGNHYLGNESVIYAVVAFLPILFLSIFLTRFFAYPFSILFKKLNEEEDRTIIGKVSKVILATSHNRKGQASVRVGKAEQKIYIKSSNNENISKGEEALILEYDNSEKCYLVQPISE
ncbi:OB-fold-containig protein [Flammeovirga kamogawensis]|uniref:DUF1449 family protein n=1 Tax=Flammeovirga kamogawensis TaxID=373891 RepID=A0ABX8GRD9_9BACT|nr:OB-fold-containig protein [Flammeovirga kamogawensis]MBB6464023.1 amino acid transporter [Flammeovirga kamogawensis]QWG06144.1 DUF1449 family protein [Flammeovirga kamogawensis]TRX67976.1 DUF1449 family protein [Flammeovirga kamogawensis]